MNTDASSDPIELYVNVYSQIRMRHDTIPAGQYVVNRLFDEQHKGDCWLQLRDRSVLVPDHDWKISQLTCKLGMIHGRRAR